MCVGICVNKGKTIYGRSRFNVKGYLRSTIVFTRGLSYIASILFARVKITRQWKSTLRGSSVVHGTEMTTCLAYSVSYYLLQSVKGGCLIVLKVYLLDVIIPSQIVGGWDELKKASVFSPIFCVPLKYACFTCLNLLSPIHQLIFYLVCWCSQVATKTKLFCPDQNFRNYSRTVLSTSTPLKAYCLIFVYSRRTSLKRTETIDKSSPLIDLQLRHQVNRKKKPIWKIYDMVDIPLKE